MQAKLYKLRPLGKQTKKIVTGYMNEGRSVNSGGTFLQNQSDIYMRLL